MKIQTDNEKFTIADAARALNVHPNSIRRAIKAGRLVPVRHGTTGRAYYVTRASVNALLKGGAQ